MKKTNLITEGAMMLALFTVLLLVSVYVPIISIAGALFLMLPFFLYSAKYSISSSLMLLTGAVIVAFLAAGPISIPVALMYGTTGIAVGTLIQKKSDGWIVYMAGSLVFLVNVVLQYVIAASLFDFSYIDQFGQMFKEAMAQTTQVTGTEPAYTPEQIDEALAYLSSLLPAILTVVSFGIVLLILAVNYPIARRLGVKIAPMRPLRMIQFPAAILWYYLLFTIASLVTRPEEGTTWYDIYINIMFILQSCLYIQGLSFIFFYAHYKKWPKAIPVIITIVSIGLFPLLYLIRLLGIIDLGFNLRQRMNKKP